MILATVRAAAAIESLGAWRERFRARLRESFAANANALLGLVRAKLSGEVLRSRSGALRASLRAAIAEDADGFQARVWSDGSLPYAHVQEYGGRIAVPEIVPKNAKALAFPYGGRLVFARRVRAHVVTIPERSYMRSSLEDFAPAFADSIRRIAGEAQA